MPPGRVDNDADQASRHTYEEATSEASDSARGISSLGVFEAVAKVINGNHARVSRRDQRKAYVTGGRAR